MKNENEKYIKTFQTIVNPLIFKKTITDNDLIFKLKLHSYSIKDFSSDIISLKKKIIENKNGSNIFKIFVLSLEGQLNIYEYHERSINIDNFNLNKIYSFEINPKYLTNINNIQLKCIDMKISFKNNSYNEIVFILTNIGLFKLITQGKIEYSINSIYDNSDGNIITSFDISDNGYIVCAFNDFTISIIDENNSSTIFTTYVPTLSSDTVIDKTYFESVICKNEKGKLVRKSLTANIYLITSKNDFIIFDFNQKNDQDLKVSNMI
jgi:hypothetical protein